MCTLNLMGKVSIWLHFRAFPNADCVDFLCSSGCGLIAFTAGPAYSPFALPHSRPIAGPLPGAKAPSPFHNSFSITYPFPRSPLLPSSILLPKLEKKISLLLLSFILLSICMVKFPYGDTMTFVLLSLLCI